MSDASSSSDSSGYGGGSYRRLRSDDGHVRWHEERVDLEGLQASTPEYVLQARHLLEKPQEAVHAMFPTPWPVQPSGVDETTYYNHIYAVRCMHLCGVPIGIISVDIIGMDDWRGTGRVSARNPATSLSTDYTCGLEMPAASDDITSAWTGMPPCSLRDMLVIFKQGSASPHALLLPCRCMRWCMSCAALPILTDSL